MKKGSTCLQTRITILSFLLIYSQILVTHCSLDNPEYFLQPDIIQLPVNTEYQLNMGEQFLMFDTNNDALQHLYLYPTMEGLTLFQNHSDVNLDIIHFNTFSFLELKPFDPKKTLQIRKKQESIDQIVFFRELEHNATHSYTPNSKKILNGHVDIGLINMSTVYTFSFVQKTVTPVTFILRYTYLDKYYNTAFLKEKPTLKVDFISYASSDDPEPLNDNHFEILNENIIVKQAQVIKDELGIYQIEVASPAVIQKNNLKLKFELFATNPDILHILPTSTRTLFLKGMKDTTTVRINQNYDKQLMYVQVFQCRGEVDMFMHTDQKVVPSTPTRIYQNQVPILDRNEYFLTFKQKSNSDHALFIINQIIVISELQGALYEQINVPDSKDTLKLTVLNNNQVNLLLQKLDCNYIYQISEKTFLKINYYVYLLKSREVKVPQCYVEFPDLDLGQEKQEFEVRFQKDEFKLCQKGKNKEPIEFEKIDIESYPFIKVKAVVEFSQLYFEQRQSFTVEYPLGRVHSDDGSLKISLETPIIY